MALPFIRWNPCPRIDLERESRLANKLAGRSLPRASLVVLSGESEGQRLPLRIWNTLGRLWDTHLVTNDCLVNRRICDIEYDGDGYYIEDFGIHERTRVNERRIEERVLLRARDVIRVGRIRLCFVEEQ